MSPLTDHERREFERLKAAHREESSARRRSRDEDQLAHAAAYAAIAEMHNASEARNRETAERVARVEAMVLKMSKAKALADGVLANPGIRLVLQAIVAIATALIAAKKGV